MRCFVRIVPRVALVACLAFVWLPHPIRAGGGDEIEALRARAFVKISMARAVEIAEKIVSEGRAFRADLRMNGNSPVYEVRLLEETRIRLVRVDAVDAKVVGTAEERLSAVLFDFDEAKTGAVPEGWSLRQTNPTRALATWEVVHDFSAPTKWNALALTKSENYDGTFNLAVADATSFRDFELTVESKAVRGKEDQGGGPVWRLVDENNYYVCRFNPLEANFRIYVVKDGERTELASATVHTDVDRWYTIQVTMAGKKIRCGLDGTNLLEVEDATFGQAGRVGLWTKADAETAFDDLAVAEIRRGE